MRHHGRRQTTFFVFLGEHERFDLLTEAQAEDEDGLSKYPWADTMAAVASACIAGSMFTFMMLAAGAVKDTFDNDKDKIDAIPIDEEVQKADDLAAAKAEAYTEAVAWTNVPIWAKTSLVLAVTCMILCVLLLANFNTRCFAEYDLMYTIEEHLDGKWHNLILPLGWYALLLTVIATFFLTIFSTWAGVSADHEPVLVNASTASRETNHICASLFISTARHETNH